MKNISFRLTAEDFAAIEAAAAHEFLPVAAFLRKLALEHARKLGVISKHPTNNPATHTPTAPITPIRNNVITREDLLKRVESGQQLRDVANSVGIQVSELQARLAQAKTARADGTLQWQVDYQAWALANPKPEDGKEYKADRKPSPDGAGWIFSWKEVVIADPTAPQPTRALTPEEELERTNELARKAELWYEGTPVQVAPRRVDPEIAAKLDGLFD